MNKKTRDNLVAAILLAGTLLIGAVFHFDLEIVLMFYAGVFLGINW